MARDVGQRGMAMSGILEGLAVEGLWAGVVAWGRRLRGSQIRITSPKADGYLEDDPQPLGPGTTYRVEGKLKRLPKHHEIWLLRQDEVSSKIWPQGFFRVVFDPSTGQWYGRVNGSGKRSIYRVIAVVTPPTTHDYFLFCQRVGNKTQHFEPLDRVPPECVNLDYVQVRTR